MRYETLQSTKFKMKSHPRLTIWRQELTSPLLLALLLRVQKSAKYLDNLKKKKKNFKSIYIITYLQPLTQSSP